MLMFGAAAGVGGLEQAVSLGGTMSPFMALPPPAQQGWTFPVLGFTGPASS
jgi:hypothetical protein